MIEGIGSKAVGTRDNRNGRFKRDAALPLRTSPRHTFTREPLRNNRNEAISELRADRALNFRRKSRLIPHTSAE